MQVFVLLEGDGTISFEEFRQVLDKYKQSKNKSHNGIDRTISVGDRSFSEMDLRETFQVFDKDEDGFLNAADLRLDLLCIFLVVLG